MEFTSALLACVGGETGEGGGGNDGVTSQPALIASATSATPVIASRRRRRSLKRVHLHGHDSFGTWRRTFIVILFFPPPPNSLVFGSSFSFYLFNFFCSRVPL